MGNLMNQNQCRNAMVSTHLEGVVLPRTWEPVLGKENLRNETLI